MGLHRPVEAVVGRKKREADSGRDREAQPIAFSSNAPGADRAAPTSRA